MKILLTGKTGQVGYELERTLQGLGEIVALDRQQMDLANLDQVRDVIRSVKPQLIINPAAYTAVDLAESAPDLAMRINADAPGVMAAEAKKLGAAMIHYSTDYVFDGDKAESYTEEDVPHPQSVYGRSKLAGEQAIQAAGIPHLILRTSWIYGLRGKNFLLTVQRLAQERDELRIVADQFGAPTWSRTLAEVTAHAICQLQGGGTQANVDHAAWSAHSGLYHVTAQGRTSWHGFTQAIIAHSSGLKQPKVTPIATQDYPLPAKRPQNSVLSSQRFMQAFCRLPEWEAALKLCVD
ncbi:dTDP-4-dehydrorhamnose reductase (dTDP-4-keto-L-rhamnose reductase) (dTDP-6-deoxy-L-mannose dehydrogenase) (dTDP-L-rhamnose synthetase) [Herminiimonas arsenicoxydans]|uniref:dTDP-4-dehydrorhamnose reductase n=1 Tax=Herminiimonas arsenicoxydans TaxID=204773 RepID=A4G497_HERAR|nr:dTDP-4-dehydrorhamnose reductase (dTDP-4-keto-L-rhamnose reductase) (dTDP-6-deoxy-L-mannose dehydrogenase) (dTDP-L-rhamnose synthetase) [Herminiimonas arsenicoxydans]